MASWRGNEQSDFPRPLFTLALVWILVCTGAVLWALKEMWWR